VLKSIYQKLQGFWAKLKPSSIQVFDLAFQRRNLFFQVCIVGFKFVKLSLKVLGFGFPFQHYLLSVSDLFICHGLSLQLLKFSDQL